MLGGSRRRRVVVAIAAGATSLLVTVGAAAETYRVGPGQDYETLQDVADRLEPGDAVELMGGATYPGSVVFERDGHPDRPVTIRGIRVGGKRPVISGGRVTIEAGGDHYVFEGIVVTGGAHRCFFHHAHDVTLRDSVIRDCPGHGLLGADDDSGSMLLETTEVYGCGRGLRRHQIYMATDPEAHPGSVFRMQHCYVHDGAGGNNVKSRAERNEVYFNWIEGAVYHELELIGPDGKDPSLAREDSDVVGNVLRKTNDAYTVRVGGDGTGATSGRYRFVNNTVLLPDDHRPVFRLFDEVESVEMHNNVIWRRGNGPTRITMTENVRWVTGRDNMAGGNNWVPEGSTAVPAGWQNTMMGKDPGFEDLDAFDLRPAEGSPLRDAARFPTRSAEGFAFPAPLTELPYQPPRRSLTDGMQLRGSDGKPDLGAYEGGEPFRAAPGAHEPPESMARPARRAAPGLGPARPGAAGGRCGCRVGGPIAPPSPLAWLLSLAVLARAARRGS